MILHDVILFLVGVIVGAMNSIAGGGMLIGFPVLLALGMPALAANVTSNVVIMFGSLSSAAGYRAYLNKVRRRYFLLVIPCIAGAAVGATILRHTSGNQFEQIVPALVGLAVILFAFQPFIQIYLRRHMRGVSKGMGSLSFVALALLPAAIYGGYFGAGFGFIMLAFLGFTDLHEIHIMTGLKNLAAAFIAATSLLCLYGTGLVDWHMGLVMAAGGVLGGYLTSRVAQKTSSHALRVLVIIIGLGTAGYLGLRNY